MADVGEGQRGTLRVAHLSVSGQHTAAGRWMKVSVEGFRLWLYVHRRSGIVTFLFLLPLGIIRVVTMMR